MRYPVLGVADPPSHPLPVLFLLPQQWFSREETERGGGRGGWPDNSTQYIERRRNTHLTACLLSTGLLFLWDCVIIFISVGRCRPFLSPPFLLFILIYLIFTLSDRSFPHSPSGGWCIIFYICWGLLFLLLSFSLSWSIWFLDRIVPSLPHSPSGGLWREACMIFFLLYDIDSFFLLLPFFLSWCV